MVRVLSCYHFRGQKIGRCEEAAAVTVAGQSIVVGIEDNVYVYNAGHSFQLSEVVEFSFDTGNNGPGQIPDIGAPILFGHADKSPLSPGDDKRLDSEHQQSGSCSSSVSSIESDTEIKLSHSFSTVDLVRSLSYNRKGNYLLCLECRDGDGGASRCSSIRVYFHWDKKCDGQPMRTRIAGVSPSSNDIEKPALTMVEIPLTSPAIAVASCTLSGHLASLSAESVINIFSFRVKDASGRGKMQYQDFDRLCAVEIPGFAPESLSFLGNFIACHGPGKIHVFLIRKSDKSWSPSVIGSDKYGTKSSRSGGRGGFLTKTVGYSRDDKSKSQFDSSNKVTFDPTDDSVTVHLPSVTRANRKRAGNTIVVEEYGSEILTNKSRIIFSSAMAGLNVEDVLRLSFPQSNPGSGVPSHEKFSGTGLYPIRINDKLGGVACAVGLTKEAMLFHLPTKERIHPIRVANYSFTAPLVTFTFDSLFFHALTESGLETYTSRSLYYALEDHEGFDRFCNACPLKSERPCLVGIRPFVRVRFMAANESLICLLACPTVENSASQQSTFSPPLSPSNPLLQDERLWTIYSLELPDIDMLYEDTMRLAKSQEGHPDTYFTLLCELYIALKAYINAVPEELSYYTPRYQNLCKAIGLEYFKASWLLTKDLKEGGNQAITQTTSHASASQNSMPASSEELLELGVTYLCMAKIDIQQVFSSENLALIQDPQFTSGTVKLIDVLISSYCEQDAVDKHNFSPALSSSIVDFLSHHSPETLVDLVIRIPFLRENHSTRLVEILQEFAKARNYAGKESVALILTFIAAGGVESNVRCQVQDILSKVKSKELEPCLRLEFILDRSAKHSALTDVAICLTAVNSELPTTIISEAVKNQEVSISEVMLAFAKAVNLNSESQIQRSLARALRSVLESFFSSKISNNNINDLSQSLPNSAASTPIVHFTDDERHAVQALVRSYISDISLSPTNKLIRSSTADSQITGENSPTMESLEASVDPENSNHEKIKHADIEPFTPETINGTEILARNQIFGKNPSFVNFLLSIEMPGGSITPANTNFSPTMFSNQESMESYIRLLSLLSSPLGKVEGVKDSVLSFVYSNSSSVTSTPLQLILQMFCEPVETAISILISRQPTTTLLYAKEMFGKNTSKWKMLVTQLKKRINLNPNTTDSDMFSTIIESVYLHLANTLSLAELEEVLEKGSDDVAKFRSTCKRVELANSYASMVIQISTDYLQNKQ